MKTPTQKFLDELQVELKTQNLFISSERLIFNESNTLGTGQFGVIFSGQLSVAGIPDKIEDVAIKRATSKRINIH